MALNTNNLSPTGGNPIQHTVEIDEMLINIAAIDQQIEHYEQLKRHRITVIAAEIDKLEGNKAQYRDAIQQFMSDQGEKTLNYPGVGKVTRKAGTRKWVIKDEEALLSYLKSNPGLSPQLLSKVVFTEERLVKKELNKILDELSTHNALQTDSVELAASQETLSISFDKSDQLLTVTKDVRSSLLASEPATAVADISCKQSFDELEI